MIKRALLAGLVVTAAALAASVAPALATPVLSIESPVSGTVTNETHPTIAGVSSDTEDAITVVVLKEGSFYESATAEPSASNQWSVQLPTPLEDGEYSVFAEQTEVGETGRSGSVSFTVKAQLRR